MPQTNENSFLCHRLWNMLSVRQQGYWGHCSSSFSHKNKGYLFESNSKKRVHISESPQDSLQNNQTLKEMRRLMLSGAVPPECQKCKELEDGNFTSLRELTNAEFGIDQELINKTTHKDGEISLKDHPLQLLELRLTNHCNLGCRSCSPESSDKLIPVHQRVWGSSTYKDLDESIRFAQDSSNSWRYEDPKFFWTKDQPNWEKLKGNIKDLKKIHLTGGEPLLIPQHIDFLSTIVDAGHSKNITLEYNSNLSFLPPRLLTLWKEFKKVQIGVSIDGPPVINEYIRRGTDTKKFEENLRILDELNLPNFSIWFPFTLMNYNIFSLPNTYRYVNDLNLKNLNKHPGHKLLRVHILKSPNFLSIDYLPQTIKTKAISFFNEFLSEGIKEKSLLPYIPEVELELSKIKNRLTANDQLWDAKVWEKFKYYTRKIDEIDGVSIEKLQPHLFN